jgi:hypothetical protein
MEVGRRKVLRWGFGAAAVGLAGCSRAGAAITGTSSTGGLAAAFLCGPTGAASCQSTGGGKWSSPSTWQSGAVPGPNDSVAVSHAVELDTNGSVESMTILPGASLTFTPSANRTLQSKHNVVVLGRLVMHPAPNVAHLLQFTDANEAAYVGGGMEVLTSDVGLWVMEGGTLDIQGAQRLAWTRVAESVAAGATSITLVDLPSGWRIGDVLALTPTRTPTPEQMPSHTTDVVTIAGINARTVTLSAPVKNAHPAVDIGRGRTMTAEVLNLTRNARIEGMVGKRAHVFVHTPGSAGRPQTVKYASLRHLGPQQGVGQGGEPDEVLGRYGIHFHHCADGSRGSVLEGLVGRDIGSHTFVPHVSNGTTWRDCIAHDVHGTAYWWDPDDSSADVLFERCVASTVRAIASERFVTTGFLLGRGPQLSNTARNCVAVNILGDGDGFLWYEGPATWVFQDNVAHNCTGNGIRVWQNTPLPHLVQNSILYRNDMHGIDNGAYGNAYRYIGGHLVGNGSGAAIIRTVSVNGDGGVGLTFSDFYVDAGGAEYCFGIDDGSPIDADRPTLIRNCEFHHFRRAAIRYFASGKNARGQVVDCRFFGNELWLDSGMGAGSLIELSDAVHGDAVVAPRGNPGTPIPAWNAVARGLTGPVGGEPEPPGSGGGGSGSSGYFLLESDGDVYAFGAARPALRSWDPSAIDDESRSVTVSKAWASAVGGAAVVAAASSDKGGLWALLSDGRVIAVGPATPAPGVTAAALTKTVAGRPEAPAALARVASGDLWVFTTAGRVIPQFGTLPASVKQWMDVVLGRDLFGPIISAQPTADGSGAYAIGSDGGVFTYDAPFLGSVYDAIALVRGVPASSVRPDQPVVGITVDPDGDGYWLVGADGGVFTFDAPFRGSLPAIAPFEELFAPVTAMVPFGNGYLLLGADGGVFNFSNQPFSGSASLLANTPITGIATIS